MLTRSREAAALRPAEVPSGEPTRGDPGQRLDRCFEAQAQRTPDQVALREADRSVTYRELGSLSDRWAQGLAARGVGAGSLVGLHVERSVEWVAAILAVLKAGAAVVPLPPSFPDRRLREIVEYCGLDAVVHDEAAPLRVSLSGRGLSFQELSRGPNGEGETAAVDAHPEDLAFVLCSSGSTDRSKLIERSHRSFFHRLEWTWSRHPFGPGEVGCQKAHMTTTHAIYELFEPLLQGVPTVVIPDPEVRDLERFWDEVRRREISRLLLVPSALRASLDMPGFIPPPRLRVLVLMGEYVPPRLAERAVAAFPERTWVYSIYGSTEASSTLVCDLREWAGTGGELPLGSPLSPDIHPLVLGTDLEPVGPEGEGRLYMGGPALFTGYTGDPGGTAEALVEVPGREGLVFDTRDRVRRRQDGELEFLGRTDHTVKVRGFRVDLQEVERTLGLAPGVRQTAVVTAGPEAGTTSLLGFVVPSGVDRGEVYRFLRERLPDYMVPSALHALDSFPLTPSSKVDRVRLRKDFADRRPEPDPDAGELATGETERRVALAWKAVLDVGSLPRDASFFEVGGTSLTVFTLVHHLRQEFDLDRNRLDEEAVYRAPTIAEQAEWIEDELAGRNAEAADASPLVLLRKGTNAELPPLFLVSPSGGTVGAYEQLARALNTARDVIGVRDPLLWGGRDPEEGFDAWVDRYVEAIRERQPRGPYHIGAYSSAGAFGYEVAGRLSGAGEKVALLALIDPLGLDRRDRWRYGYWVTRGTYAHPGVRALIRLWGWLRWPGVRLIQALGRNGSTPPAPSANGEGGGSREKAGPDPGFFFSLSGLFELNTGLPFALTDEEVADAPDDRYADLLKERVERLVPEMDPEIVDRIAAQYPLQVRAQQTYRLHPYSGPVLLVEPRTRYAGLIGAQLRPFVRNLRARTVPLGEPSDRIRQVARRFGAWESHFRSIRDPVFVRGLAAELDDALD